MRRIEWVSIANAVTIAAVIVGHIGLTGECHHLSAIIVKTIELFCMGFQMPLFMFLSGYLFSVTSGISKTWGQLVFSKAKRLLVPFVFLSIFTFSFKLCIPSSMMEHAVVFTPTFLFRMFFVPFRGPVPHLWFVVSLFCIFILSPFFKNTLKNKRLTVACVLIFFFLNFTPPHSERKISGTLSFG